MVDEDQYGLLDAVAKTSPITADDLLVAGFRQIVEFVEERGRHPDASTSDVTEMKLGVRLAALSASDEHRDALAAHDTHGLLVPPVVPTSLAEIFAADDLGILDDDAADSIRTLVHVPKSQTMPTKIAQRRPCDDFDAFRPRFEACQRDLRAGSRKLLPFAKPSQIEAGKFFVLNGVLVYVDRLGDRVANEIGKSNARTRCIFENGTESDLLLQSLASNLYKDGRRVTDPNDLILERMGLAPETKMGSVYVLRTLSTDPQLAAFSDLHKIGSTSGTVEARVAGAINDPTFLHAPVEVLAEYEMPAVATRIIEGRLHKFFSAACVDMWFERNGIDVASPQEWFDVPIQLIDEAIDLIQAETIGAFAYDAVSRAIVLESGR